ncbi:MAG: glutamate--tRNA ligase, partial [Clostridia bacterium]|nr:glutamate--tRNA ligase [Clostridia bacterium]
RMGYDPDCVCEYIMTLLNSNYEEWHMQNTDKPYTDFPFNIKKMSSSGCLFDFDKLNDVSKNVISRMTAEEVYAQVYEWAKAFDPDFAAVLEQYKERAIAAFAIGRGGKKPRKDFATWAEAKQFIAFFFPAYFRIEDEITGFAKDDIEKALTLFAEGYDEQDDSTVWFDKVKAIAEQLGYCTNMKEYKQNPDAYPGNVGDVSTFIRVALTGRTNSPDLYTVMQILGREESLSRIDNYRKGL